MSTNLLPSGTMQTKIRKFSACLALIFCAAACGSGADDVSSRYAPDASGLKSLFSDLAAANAAGDISQAAAITHNLFPGDADFQAVIRGSATGASSKINELLEGCKPSSDSQAAGLFSPSPDQTQILVHASSTEALAAYKQGTPAFEEFPGGAQELAQTVLSPGVTFYEVECLKPGEERGMKYHLFFNVGEGWKTLGPAWRAF